LHIDREAIAEVVAEAEAKRIICVVNQKGGVGKTTTTVNLGAALARRGLRVLMLDMDPQANLTVHVDKRPDLEGQTMTNLLVEDAPLQGLVQPTATPNLSVVPADTSLAGVEQVLANRIGRETILREALDACLEASPVVVLLDWNMPVMSGMEFLRALRETDVSPRPKVVFCTTENGMAYIRAAIEAGADEYVMKPFDRETLQSKLQIVGVA
jgi:two-component system chemotaxis response regulator CheY